MSISPRVLKMLKGRRHHTRQLRNARDQRRVEVSRIMRAGTVTPTAIRRMLPEKYRGSAIATISHDIAAIKHIWLESRRCPICRRLLQADESDSEIIQKFMSEDLTR